MSSIIIGKGVLRNPEKPKELLLPLERVQLIVISNVHIEEWLLIIIRLEST